MRYKEAIELLLDCEAIYPTKKQAHKEFIKILRSEEEFSRALIKTKTLTTLIEFLAGDILYKKIKEERHQSFVDAKIPERSPVK